MGAGQRATRDVPDAPAPSGLAYLLAGLVAAVVVVVVVTFLAALCFFTT